MRTAAPAQRTPVEGAPPWIGASPVAALLALQRPWIEASELLRSAVWRGNGVPDGGGLPVLLVPGFLAGDPSLSMMKRWLRARGYRPCTSQIRINVDCTRQAVERLERRLVEFTDRTGRPAAIVGQSRGGLFAKIMAMRQPDRVAGIVTLGSPNVDHMAINPMVAQQVRFVARLGTAGVPGMFRDDCLQGQCAEELAGWLDRAVPGARAVRLGLLAQRLGGRLARVRRPGCRQRRDRLQPRRDERPPAGLPAARRAAGRPGRTDRVGRGAGSDAG